MGNKLTIIKVMSNDGHPSPEDLERWRKMFADHQMTDKQADATGEVFVEYIAETKEDEHYITLVRVGDKEYSPSLEDLEQWRKVFEDAKGDPDFKIFTHPAVDISVINIGKVIAVE